MSRTTTKQVRAIVKKHYSVWFSFNDIRKDKKTRRVKFMCNGFRETDKFYKTAADSIRQELKDAGIWFRDDGFKEGECDRGGYVYYSVVIEA